MPAVARGERAADGRVPGHYLLGVRLELADAGGRRSEVRAGFGRESRKGRGTERTGFGCFALFFVLSFLFCCCCFVGVFSVLNECV